MKPAWWVAATAVAVHFACTTYLWFRYLPQTDDPLVGPALAVVPVAAVVLVAASAYLLAEEWVDAGRVRWIALLPVVLGIALLLCGPMVTYDQLAVRDVVASAPRGYRAAFEDDVLFLLFDGRRISVTAYRTWVALDVYVLPFLAAAALWLAHRPVQAAAERARARHAGPERPHAVREAVIRGDDHERRRFGVR